jgi:hypothetical protein
VGVGNFTISFDLVDTDKTNNQTIVNQRTNCTSNSPYWDIQLNAAACGTYSLAVMHYVNATGLITHCTDMTTWGNLPASGYHVIIHRQNGRVELAMGSTNWGDTWADATDWDAFSPVSIGAETASNCKVGALDGTVSNVCVEKE